ncbi:nucleolar complex-associated protein-domain-containing protein [Phyllosticta citribraziliensis]|uniref:Nucleolar complex-associated protein 3 n=1 Tax=Phyllosticta citribraziliensis TaxID=989973 RepID=A0ABR1L647_9PEZI
MPAAKRRRLSPPESADDKFATQTPAKSRHGKVTAGWDAEQDYEQRPRKHEKKKDANRLPIKTPDGLIQQLAVPEPEKSEEVDNDSFLGTSSDEGESEEVEEEEETKPVKTLRQQIFEAKEELAKFAETINEDPEEHVGGLKQLAHIADSSNVTIKKLALATQAAVYKDIIPGYRIRAMGDDALKEKLSKDVKRLRSFEQSLVHGYKDYLSALAKCAKNSKQDAPEDLRSLATVAIGCACNLLLQVPHFNFRGDLLKILVDKLSTKSIDADFAKCRSTIEKLFEEDEDGNASLEAVQMITRMIKARHYNVHESVLNTFLHLRLLSEFSSKGSYDRIDKVEEDRPRGKKSYKKEFRTKKQRKLMKEQKSIEKEMKEADAAVSHEERDRMQSESLKLVFVTYFRILKSRAPSLMGAVLEGLARYSHLINQDFFGDILEALKDLITDAEELDTVDEDVENDADAASIAARNATRESLLCVITAFALLQGQDATKAASGLHLDLDFFITHLYRTLYPASLNADIELSAQSLHLPDPSISTPTANNKVNASTTAVLLLRALSSTLLPANTAIRAVPPTRLAAFTKTLLTASLHLPEKSTRALLALLNKVTRVHGRKVAALWNTEERKGDGVWDPLLAGGRGRLEASNPFASTVWEGHLLRHHFSPAVREAYKGVEKNVVEVLKGS